MENTQNHLSDLKETARRAFNWISFNPEKRGDDTLKAYSQELEEDIALIGQHADTEANRQQAVERYVLKYKQHLRAWLHSQSNTASSAITGPAKFPVHRQEKLHRWADNKHEQFREYRQRALKAILKSFKPAVTPLSELETAQKNLAEREAEHARMKAVNVIIRKYAGVERLQPIIDLGYSEEEAVKLLVPNVMGDIGFASYKLTNNNAQINRLRDRVAELEKKTEAIQEGNNERTVEGIRIVDNFEADRYQLFFDGKPAQVIIDRMKGAWKWSPSNKCWQRKITANAKWDLDRLLTFITEENKKARVA